MALELTLTSQEEEATRLWIANEQRKLKPLTKAEENAVRLWLASLEMERTDRSYLRKPEPKETYRPTVIVQERKRETKAEAKAREKRERAFFNAGRYVAGDRDKTASAAYELLERDGEL